MANTSIISFKIDLETKQALYEYARQTQRHVSEIIREALRIYLEKHGVKQDKIIDIDGTTILVDIDEEDVSG